MRPKPLSSDGAQRVKPRQRFPAFTSTQPLQRQGCLILPFILRLRGLYHDCRRNRIGIGQCSSACALWHAGVIRSLDSEVNPMNVVQPGVAAAGPPPQTVYVSFTAEINASTTENLLAGCANLANAGVKTVYLLLSTPGGQVLQGITLYNTLRAMPFKLITHNVGE